MRTAASEPAPAWRRQDVLGGVVLLLVAGLALWQSAGLPAGTLGSMGAGMIPRLLAVLLAGLGLLLVISAVTGGSAPLERWTLRGPVMILGAVVLFGLSVRGLGLAVAGPLAVCVGALASPETRLRETLIFAVVLTAFCVGLFKFALGLPIPFAPWLVGY